MPEVTQPSEVIHEGRVYLLYGCPEHFIPESVMAWEQGYRYHTKFPGARLPSFDEVSPRWLEAMELFEMYNNEISREIEMTMVKDG